ncbi:uncharacterized protein [Dasypus novemcinctus]|uniref:uncharacterized protein n=1 Tax=Dasypus novemcinctus TaxID=9361 RepID=UPI0039C8D63F
MVKLLLTSSLVASQVEEGLKGLGVASRQEAPRPAALCRETRDRSESRDRRKPLTERPSSAEGSSVAAGAPSSDICQARPPLTPPGAPSSDICQARPPLTPPGAPSSDICQARPPLTPPGAPSSDICQARPPLTPPGAPSSDTCQLWLRLPQLQLQSTARPSPAALLPPFPPRLPAPAASSAARVHALTVLDIESKKGPGRRHFVPGLPAFRNCQGALPSEPPTLLDLMA